MVGPKLDVARQTLKKFEYFLGFKIEAFYLNQEMVKTLGFSNAKLYIILQQILH